jgi:hypothetical protein
VLNTGGFQSATVINNATGATFDDIRGFVYHAVNNSADTILQMYGFDPVLTYNAGTITEYQDYFCGNYGLHGSSIPGSGSITTDYCLYNQDPNKIVLNEGPTQLTGTVSISGTSSAGLANGFMSLYASTSLGGIIRAQGSGDDLTVLFSNGATAFQVVHSPQEVSFPSPVLLSPANGNIVIEPSGTGTVTIDPATAGTLDNVAIGQSVPLLGAFTGVSLTGPLTLSETLTATSGVPTATAITPTYAPAASSTANPRFNDFDTTVNAPGVAMSGSLIDGFFAVRLVNAGNVGVAQALQEYGALSTVTATLGTVTDAYGDITQPVDYTASGNTGTFTYAYGHRVLNSTLNGITIGTQIGYEVDAFTSGGNNVEFMAGGPCNPTGNFAFYQCDSNPNLLNGALTVVGTTTLGLTTAGIVTTTSGGVIGSEAVSSLSVGTATNLAGGTADELAYQTGAGATAFLATCNSGLIETSSGGVPSCAATPAISPTMTATASGAVSAFSATPSLSPASNSSATFRSLSFDQTINDGTINFSGNIYGGYFDNRLVAGGTFASLIGVQAYGAFSSATSAFTSASAVYGFLSQPVDLAGSGNSGTISAAYAYSAGNSALNGATLTGQAGYQVGALSGATNNVEFLGGTGTIPSGSWGWYQADTSNNALHGSLAVGSTTAPSATLTVTGTETISSTLGLSGALTYGGVTLSNAVTGTGNMVLSASPTFTGTIAVAAETLTSTLTLAGGTLLATSAALTNGAASATATLTNAPSSGNPTKWVPINDNGTTRYIPTW